MKQKIFERKIKNYKLTDKSQERILNCNFVFEVRKLRFNLKKLSFLIFLVLLFYSFDGSDPLENDPGQSPRSQ